MSVEGRVYVATEGYGTVVELTRAGARVQLSDGRIVWAPMEHLQAQGTQKPPAHRVGGPGAGGGRRRS